MLKHAQHNVTAERVEVVTHCVMVNLLSTIQSEGKRKDNEEEGTEDMPKRKKNRKLAGRSEGEAGWKRVCVHVIINDGVQRARN